VQRALSRSFVRQIRPSSLGRVRSLRERIVWSDCSGRRKVKGNMDVELAVDGMELAAHIDQMVLFPDDGDFRPLVEAIQHPSVRVPVISTISSQPPMTADELRRRADIFTDLVELQSKVCRAPLERPALRERVDGEARGHLPTRYSA
jgi:uncharacterized LabA/DUF88 family protein